MTAMADQRPPFRADHVGSLLRPPALKALRLEREAGRATPEALRAAEDAAIRDAVALQEGVGLQGITDGEMRRKAWHMDFLLQLGGLSSEGKSLPVTFTGKSGEMFFTRPDLAVTGRVTRPRPIFVEGFRFLRSAVQRTAKLTLPSPSMLYTQVGTANVDRQRLSQPRRVRRGHRGRVSRGDRRPLRGGLPLSPARRREPGLSLRRVDARAGTPARRRSRRPARAVRRHGPGRAARSAA